MVGDRSGLNNDDTKFGRQFHKQLQNFLPIIFVLVIVVNHGERIGKIER